MNNDDLETVSGGVLIDTAPAFQHPTLKRLVEPWDLRQGNSTRRASRGL